jgi:DNA-binding beta-propeller fold protein YncE
LVLGDKPEFAVTDGHGLVFVNLEDSSAVVCFDAATLALKSRWALTPGERPTGLAIDREHQRLFSVCGNDTMMVLDAASGRVVAIIPIGKGVDAAAFDPATQMAFASCGDGTLTVIHEDSPDRFRVVSTVTTQRGARTMALDPRTHRIFTATAQFGEPPPPTPDRPRPRPPMVPGTFEILVLDPAPAH